MRNIAGNDLALKYSNLYSINKTTEIESGLSAVLGFDFTKNTMDTNNNEIEKLSKKEKIFESFYISSFSNRVIT